MNKKIFGSIILVSSVLLMSCGNAITLKFNLSKGSKFDYTMHMNMNIHENVMGNNVNVENKMAMGYIFEVVNDSAGWKTISSTINKIGININTGGGQTMKFDTDSAVADTTGASGIFSKVFGAMKGGQFSFIMNDKGHIGEVFGIKEMMEHMLSTLNVPNAEMLMQNVGKSFDAENFKQNIEQSFNTYPDKPVKPGDSWQKTINLNSNGLPMKSENTYTLISVTGNIANVKVSSKISSGADSAATGTKDLNGTTTGTMDFDIPTGIPVNGNLDMKMSMKVIAQGQEIPVNMNMKMTIEGKKL